MMLNALDFHNCTSCAGVSGGTVAGAPGVGAIRLRLVATKGEAFALRDEDGKYLPHVLLDLDYWGLIPV